MSDAAAGNPWVHELRDALRGVCGGMLFGVPLLYTQEVWYVGSYTRAPRLLGMLLLALAPTFFLAHTAGFRGSKDVRYRDAAKDSVEALALALVCAAGVLLLLRQVTTQTPLGPALGRVVLEAVPFAIGMALSRHFLAGAPDEGQDPDDEQQRHSHGRLPSANPTVTDLGATAIGAIFVALNIAPTDEIQIIAATMTPAWLLGVLLASLVISYCIVFMAGFGDEQRRRRQRGVLQHPLTETVVSYLVSLLMAAGMLWFFQRLELGDPWYLALTYVVVLGLPSAIGGAAGRLAV